MQPHLKLYICASHLRQLSVLSLRCSSTHDVLEALSLLADQVLHGHVHVVHLEDGGAAAGALHLHRLGAHALGARNDEEGDALVLAGLSGGADLGKK